MQIDEATNAVKAQYLHRNLPALVLSGFGGSLMVAAILWDTVSRIKLLALLAAYAVYAIYRFTVWRSYRGVTFTTESARRFFLLSLLGSLLASGLWTASMLFFYAECSLAQQFVFLVAIVMVGVSSMSGQCSHYPSFLTTFLPFSLSALLIMVSQEAVFVPAVAGLLIFIPAMLAYAWRFHRLLIESLRLRFENVDLVAQLTEQKEAAEAATLAKSRFLAAASHDLRQPMHALNLYLGVLAGCSLPPQAEPVLAKVRQCAQTMDDMFRALLDISRLDASVVQADIKTFSMAPLLERIRTEFMPQARAKGLALRVAPCSACVSSDPALVERILRNLVSNAVRYTVHGKILVGCRRTASGLRLVVCDTGPGIAPDQQQAVFEEFYQVGNPERDRAQGLGLGLAIVQRLARLLDTQVRLASTIGRGSMFSIELSGAVCLEGVREQVEPEAVNVTNVAGAVIAVVDDEVAILDAMRHLLEQWGCTVITATSGNEAAAKLKKSVRQPDALVCDYRLRGEETGLMVIQRLCKELNHDMPALLITGDTAPDRIRQTQASGLTVLHKPIQELALQQALSRLIDSHMGTESVEALDPMSA